jgi:hypothetical protein
MKVDAFVCQRGSKGLLSSRIAKNVEEKVCVCVSVVCVCVRERERESGYE